MVVGSNPTEPTFESNSSRNPRFLDENAEVLQLSSLLLQFQDVLGILLGNKGKRYLELRQKTNEELFNLYEGELAFHHRSARGINEAKRILSHFRKFIGESPPTPELAKSFLSNFTDRKPTTLARYAAVLKVLFKWYGEELN